MKQKLYSVDVLNKDYYYVIAFSKEHAIVEVVNMSKGVNIIDNPTDYSIDCVKEISMGDAEEIIIDYNYMTESYEKMSLKEFYKDLVKKEEDIYGVICDDFIAYPESYDKTLLEIQKEFNKE